LFAAANTRVLTLDGDTSDDIDRHRSYEAVGHLVVRNCDLLIAIWDDDKPPRGRGGTADTVQYALRGGVPVLWIHASKDVPPKWLDDTLDLPRLGVGPDAPGTPVEEEIHAYIVRAILPPRPAEPDVDGVWDHVMAWLRRLFRVKDDPLLAFLEETGEPNHKFWNLHPIFIRALRARGARIHAKRHARRTGQPVTQRLPAASPAAPQIRPKNPHRWLGRLAYLLAEPFRRNPPTMASSAAASLSALYQHRYRTSYTLVFVCGALALIAAVIGLAFDIAEGLATCVELLTLGLILLLVVANQVLRWHERYISYRMLGELMRMTQHLHGLGWNLPGSRVNNLAHSTRRKWVAWFFAATVRATPLAAGSFTDTSLAATKTAIVETLVGGQLCFHDKRRIECRGAAHILSRWGRALFLLTLVIVLTRVVLLLADDGHGVILWLSLACALLPAASAAFFGLREYEELGALADQSEQMLEALRRAQTRITQVAVNRPLASQVLGVELFDIVTIMLSDVAGWAQLFRMKAVDP
jgi:hypothetical protein